MTLPPQSWACRLHLMVGAWSLQTEIRGSAMILAQLYWGLQVALDAETLGAALKAWF